jgi:hypothetical protein|tara:strand:+ start:171 stop:410 length:240 start_codon:yes stop_codon:yes gene_type:complete
MAIIPIFQPSEELFRRGVDAVLTGAGMDEAGAFASVRLTPITTTQKNALPNVKGTLVYDGTLNKLCQNTGAGWETVTSI